MTDTNTTKLRERIANLVKKATSCTEIGNIAEAAAFADKAAQLARKYALSLSEIELAASEIMSIQFMVTERVHYPPSQQRQSGMMHTWMLRIVRAVCTAHGCYPLYFRIPMSKQLSALIIVSGREVDVQLARHVMTTLISVCDRIGYSESRKRAREAKEQGLRPTKRVKEGFSYGFSQAVYDALTPQHETDHGPGLVRMNKMAQDAEDWMKASGSVSKSHATTRRADFVDPASFRSGHAAGAGAMERGTGNGNQLRIGD